tara:strand:- start:1484 stop:1717 length:234 start_codon:yes stop_codon:yes gene_type:complete
MTNEEQHSAMSTVMGKEWAREQNQRSKDMAELYALDERDKEGPHKGTYTGLYQEILIYEKWRKRFYPMDEVCKYINK